MVAASVYSVSAFIFRLGGCLRSGVRSSFRRGDFAEEGKWERGCVASGSCSVGGPYKALGVPHALAFASEAVCASAGFAHNDAFLDVRGARCFAARCQCAWARVGRQHAIVASGVCPGRGVRTLRWGWDAICEEGVVVWLRLLGLLLSPGVPVVPLPDELLVKTARCIHSGRPWDYIVQRGGEREAPREPTALQWGCVHDWSL